MSRITRTLFLAGGLALAVFGIAEKGKAKIGLSAADGYGDVTSATLKVKLKRK
jgi:hypothetical protein